MHGNIVFVLSDRSPCPDAWCLYLMCVKKKRKKVCATVELDCVEEKCKTSANLIVPTVVVHITNVSPTSRVPVCAAHALQVRQKPPLFSPVVEEVLSFLVLS